MTIDIHGRGELREWFTVFVALIVLAFLGTSCNPKVNERKVPVSFLAPAFLSLDTYVREFESAYPTIEVNVTYRTVAPDKWPEHFDSALLLTMPYENTYLLQDLSPLVKDDPHFEKDEFYPGVLSSGYVNGRLVAVPVTEGFAVLVYDPDQLPLGKEMLLNPSWTWNDMLNVVTSNSAAFVHEWERDLLLRNCLMEHVRPFDMVSDKFVPAIDRSDVVAELEQMVSERKSIKTLGSNAVGEQALSYLVNKQAAMTVYRIDAPSYASVLRSRYPQLKITSLPQSKTTVNQDLFAHAVLSMSRGARDTHATWEWLSFLSRRLRLSQSFPARHLGKGAGFPVGPDEHLKEVVREIMIGQDGRTYRGRQDALGIILDGVDYAVYLFQSGLASSIEQAANRAQEETAQHVQMWYEGQDSKAHPFQVRPYASGLQDNGNASRLRVYLLDGDLPQRLQSFDTADPASRRWDIQVVPTLDEADATSFVVNADDPLMLLSMHTELLSVSSLEELGSAVGTGDIFPQALEAVSWKGQIAGIPTAIRPAVLYYDQSAFSRSGISVPTQDWTVEDVLGAAEKIAKAGLSRPAFTVQRAGDVHFVLEQIGINLFSSGPDPQPRFADPEVIRAVDRLRRLNGGHRAFGFSGNTVMILSATPFLAEEQSFHVTALRPRKETSWPMEVHVGGVPKGSQHVSEAWRWCLFVQQHPELYPQALPALRSLARERSVQSRLGKEYYNAYMTALARAPEVKIDDVKLVTGLSLFWFDQALRNVGPETDLRSVLEPAQVKAQAFLTCTGPEVKDMAQLSACARRVDPDHPLARAAP